MKKESENDKDEPSSRASRSKVKKLSKFQEAFLRKSVSLQNILEMGR